MNVMNGALLGTKSVAARMLATFAVVVFFVGTAAAQFQETEFRAGDGTAYHLLRVSTLSSGGERVRVTTVAGSSSGVGGCNLSQNMSGGVAAGIAGPLPPGQSLHPFGSITRTAIVTPNDVNAVTFIDTFGGRLQLGAGVGALNVCHSSFDCTGQPNIQSLVGLDQSTGGVPAACIANLVSAGDLCDGNNKRNTFGFGIPQTSNVCNDPTQVTANSTICAPEPADGFTLIPGQALVFIYNTSLAGVGFSLGSAGFDIDTNGINPPGCAANQIVGATTRLDSNPGAPLATDTPTNTPTNTPTATRTNTPTATTTNTPTATLTATNTFTPTTTATATFTRTATPTQTNTPPPTPTRPPIPVVPSPTSPAGLVMITGLGIGLLWALRRLARTGA